MYFHAFSECFVSLVSLEKLRKFAKKKRNLSEHKVYTRLWEVCNDKKMYFFPDPVNIPELGNIQYWNVRGSNRGKGYMVILHC